MKRFFANFRIKCFLWSLLASLAVFFYFAGKVLFLPFLLGFLFALLLQPAVTRIERHGFGRTTSISLVFFVFFTILGLVFLYVLPKVIGEIESFQKHKLYYTKAVSKRYNELKISIEKRYPKIVPWTELEHQFHQPRVFSAKRVLALPRILGDWFEFFFQILLLPPLFAFFLLKDGPALKKQFLRLIPNRYFELVLALLYNINLQIVAFIRGQMLDSSINAVLYSVGFSMVGLPYAILIGVVGGMANAIPVLGPICTGLVAVVVALLSPGVSPWLVFFVFLVIHVVDMTLIYPTMVGHSLRLHEVVVLVGVIVGGHLYGVLGMLLAVPLLGVLIRSTQITYTTLKGYRMV